MGLCIEVVEAVRDVESWGSSYRGFNDVRREVARAAGYDLDAFLGYGGSTPYSSLDGAARWLAPLLSHSDCTGYLASNECREVAGAIRHYRANVAEGFAEIVDDLLRVLDQGAERCGVHFH